MSAKLLAISIWEAVELLDRVDQEPFGEVSKLLDEVSKKLVRAAIDAEALAKEESKMTDPEWTATHTLDRQIADARQEMGEQRWAELEKEWKDA